MLYISIICLLVLVKLQKAFLIHTFFIYLRDD